LLQGEEGEKMGKRRLRMMAVAMALVVAAGQSGAGFVSGMGSVTKVCAETEDTTEQEYITADGCYTLWMVVKQTERSDKLVIVNHVLLDGRACKGKTPVHFKIYSIIDSEMDRGFCYIL
jgi:hypothetical protein